MTAQTETPAQPTTYHFILTVQRQNGVVGTRTDIVDIPAGTTRQQALGYLANQYWPGETFAVLFFDLTPNKL